MLIDRKDIEDTSEVTILLCLRTEALTLRCLGYLIEQGLNATMSDRTDSLNIVAVTLKGRYMERVNFALYLVEQWSLQDA